MSRFGLGALAWVVCAWPACKQPSFTAGVVQVADTFPAAGEPAGAPNDPHLCPTPWWSAEAGPTGAPAPLPARSSSPGAPHGSFCPADPAAYARTLAAPAATTADAERTTWARAVYDAANSVLLPDDARNAACTRPTWHPAGRAPRELEGVLLVDGEYRASPRAAVPSTLLLPRVPAEQPFSPRGAVLVIHGHDAGRREVAGHPQGYQKAIALRLAREGFVVLAPDLVTWGEHVLGGGKAGQHASGWRNVGKGTSSPAGGNPFITYALVDLIHGVTLLAGLHVAPDPKTGVWRPASPKDANAVAAVKAIGVSGLSFGAQMAAYLLLDPRPRAYVVASGLIDSCDVAQSDHHACQRISAFEGRLTLWDWLTAAAWLPRPTSAGAARAHIQVQQGAKDPILRAWGKAGLAELSHVGTAWPLPTLSVRIDPEQGHTYLVEDTLSFFRSTLE